MYDYNIISATGLIIGFIVLALLIDYVWHNTRKILIITAKTILKLIDMLPKQFLLPQVNMYIEQLRREIIEVDSDGTLSEPETESHPDL